MTVAHTPYGETLFAKLASAGIIISHIKKVVKYLKRHQDLVELLPSVCESVRKEFGPIAELSLAVYQDPETSDVYLTLYVRLPSYDGNIMQRIERAWSDYEKALGEKSGRLLVTTDFRRIGQVNGL